jgi:hypothetical protein
VGVICYPPWSKLVAVVRAGDLIEVGAGSANVSGAVFVQGKQIAPPRSVVLPLALAIRLPRDGLNLLDIQCLCPQVSSFRIVTAADSAVLSKVKRGRR